MFKKFYGFVGSLSFLPHVGEEIDDSYMDLDCQFLHDETEPSEDDWDEYDDCEEDEFDALMRKKERREAEIFAWSMFGLGVSAVVGLYIFLYHKFLKNA